MSVDVSIKQGGLLKKKFTFDLFDQLCSKLGFCYGISNTALALDHYNPQEHTFTDTSFIVYRTGSIGRGFGFWVKDGGCGLRLNNPCTNGDIRDFFTFIKALCPIMKAKDFMQDGERTSAADIPDHEARIQAWNLRVLRDFARKDDGMTVFGAIFPLALERQFQQQLLDAPDAELDGLFADYLHNKQNQDRYYAKALLYRNNDDGSIFGNYVLTQEVDSILPLSPYIPLGAGLHVKTPVSSWLVALVGEQEGSDDFGLLGRLSFDAFKEALDLEQYPRFDHSHILITLDKNTIDKLLPLAQD